MPLSAAVTKELQSELEEWKLLHQQAKEKIAALEAILASPRVTWQTKESTPVPPRDHDLNSNRGSTSTDFSGFRASIRGILANEPNVRPCTVIAALVDAGFVAGGKTTLETKVYNELYRMAKNGLLRKSKAGRYSLVGGGNSNAA